MKKLIIIGASGHGKVIADIAEDQGYEILGFLDDNKQAETFMNYHILGTTDSINEYKDQAVFVIAIGDNFTRKKLSEKYNVEFCTLIHSTAVIGSHVSIGEGTVVMAKAVVNAGAEIGRHCIINSAAVIEHDNVIEDFVHISPGAVLCGTVSVGMNTHIGAGSVIKNNQSIRKDCIIGAGSVVVRDITESGTYVGIPCKKVVK